MSDLAHRVDIIVCDNSLLEFKHRLSEKLEGPGGAAMNAQQRDVAISEYSAFLSLDTASLQGLLIERSKAYVVRGLWENALNDANTVCSFALRRVVLVDGIVTR